MAQYVIYIPGLGDHRSYGQDIALQFWRLIGLRPRYLPLGWNKKEGLDTKLAHIATEVTKLKNAGHSVALVGVSAGASAALNVYATLPDVSSVVCICGKINNPQTVKEKTFTANPDFKESLDRLNASLPLLGPEKRQKIMSMHPWKDQTVPVADTILEGAKETTIPGWSHVMGIFFAVTLGSFAIARFIFQNRK